MLTRKPVKIYHFHVILPCGAESAKKILKKTHQIQKIGVFKFKTFSLVVLTTARDVHVLAMFWLFKDLVAHKYPKNIVGFFENIQVDIKAKTPLVPC